MTLAKDHSREVATQSFEFYGYCERTWAIISKHLGDTRHQYFLVII